MNRRLAILLLCAAVTPAFAQAGPSEEQQRQACMGDALRLCAAYVPDHARIRDCMESRHDELSQPCRAVFDASLQAMARKR